jgi:hypothetical protein
MSSAGAGTDFTVAFDPTELLGSRTWGDASTDTIVWTWDRATGTDPTLTFGSALVTVGGGLTTTLDLIVTGGDITLGATSIFSGGDVASLNNIDAIDATTETTLEAAIDALANLVTTGTITTGVWNAGAVTSSGAITATSGVDLGTSQALVGTTAMTIGNTLVGTTAMTIGNNGQTIAINSSDWDISTTGTITLAEWQGTAIADAYIPNNITIDLATLATTLTITDNEATVENNPIVFVAGGDLDGGNLGLETDGDAYYTPSTGIITATGFAGALTGNVTGNVSGTAATVTGAAQAAITSLGTLTTLTVDDITVNGNTISSAGASTLAITPTAGQTITFDGVVTLDAGVIAGATSITSTAFVGALTGNADTVTTNANLTGDVTSVGNAATIAAASVEFSMVDNTITLAGNPALAASESYFGTTGIIFEGLTANDIEGLLTVADVATTDKTWTLRDASGTILLSGDTLTGEVTATFDTDGSTATTIADSVSVSSWTIDSPTFTTGITATDLLTNAHFTHSTDWGDIETDGSGNVLIDADNNVTITGDWNFGGATNFELPNAAAPTLPNLAGEVALDTNLLTGSTGQGILELHSGVQLTYLVGTIDTPADNEIPKYNSTTGTIQWEADAGAAGGDSISIDSVAVVDPDFQDTATINITDTANVVTMDVIADSINGAQLSDTLTLDAVLNITGNDTRINDGFGLTIGSAAQVDIGNLMEFEILGTGATDTGFAIGRWTVTTASGPTMRFMKSNNGTIPNNTIVADNGNIGTE